MTPECAPVSGGTELLLYVNLPENMPTTAITVKFSCEPVNALEDASFETTGTANVAKGTATMQVASTEGLKAGMEVAIDKGTKDEEIMHVQEVQKNTIKLSGMLKFNHDKGFIIRDNHSKYSTSPVLKDMEQLGNVSEEEAAKLPLAGPLDVFVCGHLDVGGRGIRCMSPPLSPENVNFFKYHVELSLDGRRYLSNPLTFTVYDLKITRLSPNIGPLREATDVVIECDGLVQTEIQKTKLSFPWGNKELPAQYDNTINKVKFKMPELNGEVRQNVEAELAKIQEFDKEMTTPQVVQQEAEEAPPADPAADPADPAAEPIDPMEQVDKDGGLHALETIVELSLNGQNFTDDKISFTYYGTLVPEEIYVFAPASPEMPKPDIESDKMPPGTVLGVVVQGLIYSEYAKMKFRLMKIINEEPVEHQAAYELEAKCEFEEKGMITAQVPWVSSLGFGEEVTEVVMADFQISLNGQHWVPCTEQPPLKLELGVEEQGEGEEEGP